MKRYLIFNASCSACKTVAEKLKSLANEKLEIIDIKSTQAKEYLSLAFPKGWKYQPYLVTVKEDRVSVAAGYDMALQLGIILGPRKAWKVYSLARQHRLQVQSDIFSLSRRKVLKYVTLFSTALFSTTIGIVNPRKIVAQTAQSVVNLYSLPNDEVTAFKEIVKNSISYNFFKSQLDPNFQEGEVFTLGIDQEAFVIIPIKYESNAISGGFAARINREQRLITDTTAISIKPVLTSYEVRFWNNDKIKGNIVLNSEGIVVSGLWFEENGNQTDLSGQNFVTNGQLAFESFKQELGLNSFSTTTKQNKLNTEQDKLNTQSSTSLEDCFVSCLSDRQLESFGFGALGAICGFSCAAFPVLGLACTICAATILIFTINLVNDCLTACNTTKTDPNRVNKADSLTTSQ